MKTLKLKILDWLSGGLLTDFKSETCKAYARADTTARLNEELRRKLYVTEAKLFEARRDLDTARAMLREVDAAARQGKCQIRIIHPTIS